MRKSWTWMSAPGPHLPWLSLGLGGKCDLGEGAEHRARLHPRHGSILGAPGTLQSLGWGGRDVPTNHRALQSLPVPCRALLFPGEERQRSGMAGDSGKAKGMRKGRGKSSQQAGDKAKAAFPYRGSHQSPPASLGEAHLVEDPIKARPQKVIN